MQTGGDEKSIATVVEVVSGILKQPVPEFRPSIESGSESNYKKKLPESWALFQRGDSEMHAGGSSR